MRSNRLKTVAAMNEMQAHPTRGFVVGWERDRGILIELADSSRDVVLASSLVALSEAELDQAVAERRPALLTFEDGDRNKPMVLGLVASVPARPRSEPSARGSEPGLIADDVVIVRGRDSIELRCGAASITLRKDGRILVRGTYVMSRASKENRIVGGSVHFN